MNIKEFEELKKLTKKIGLDTLEDLRTFQKLEGCNSWDILQALRTYSEELGEDFTIKQ